MITAPSYFCFGVAQLLLLLRVHASSVAAHCWWCEQFRWHRNLRNVWKLYVTSSQLQQPFIIDSTTPVLASLKIAGVTSSWKVSWYTVDYSVLCNCAWTQILNETTKQKEKKLKMKKNCEWLLLYSAYVTRVINRGSNYSSHQNDFFLKFSVRFSISFANPASARLKTN